MAKDDRIWWIDVGIEWESFISLLRMLYLNGESTYGIWKAFYSIAHLFLKLIKMVFLLFVMLYFSPLLFYFFLDSLLYFLLKTTTTTREGRLWPFLSKPDLTSNRNWNEVQIRNFKTCHHILTGNLIRAIFYFPFVSSSHTQV